MRIVPEIPGIVIESSCDLDLEETEKDPFRTPVEDESKVHVPDPSRYIVYHPEAVSKNP